MNTLIYKRQMVYRMCKAAILLQSSVLTLDYAYYAGQMPSEKKPQKSQVCSILSIQGLAFIAIVYYILPLQAS